MRRDSNYKTNINGIPVSYSKKLSKWIAKRRNIEFSGSYEEVKMYCKSQTNDLH